jgi:hypothetical protein
MSVNSRLDESAYFVPLLTLILLLAVAASYIRIVRCPRSHLRSCEHAVDSFEQSKLLLILSFPYFLLHCANVHSLLKHRSSTFGCDVLWQVDFPITSSLCQRRFLPQNSRIYGLHLVWSKH